MGKKKYYLILLSLFLMGCAIKKTNLSIELGNEDLEIIEFLFEEFKGDKPGASVLVIQKGKLVHKENYGLADVANEEKINSETNFRIASVAKQFTAVGIMQLVENGELEYDTRLTNIFPDFPDYGALISVRHLLTHQSGLIDYYDFFEEDRVKQALDAEVLSNLMTKDSTYFEPGSKRQYSNSGYAVLAQIVEKISGSSFAEFMESEVFQKLDMNTTCVFELDTPIQNRAFGYLVENDSITFKDQSVTSAIQGDGGIYCSTLEYYKWDQALYSNKLLPQVFLEDAFFNWDDAERTDTEGYGYGWYVGYEDGLKLLYHSGGTSGFETQVIRVPAKEITAVIFTNSNVYNRNLYRKARALISIYTDFELAMPIEVMVKKETAEKGIKAGIQCFDKLKSNPKYRVEKTTLNFLGMEYYRYGKLHEATELFKKAIAEAPNNFGGYYGMAIVSNKNENFDMAIKYYQKVLEVGAPEEAWMIKRVEERLEKLLKR